LICLLGLVGKHGPDCQFTLLLGGLLSPSMPLPSKWCIADSDEMEESLPPVSIRRFSRFQIKLGALVLRKIFDSGSPPSEPRAKTCRRAFGCCDSGPGGRIEAVADSRGALWKIWTIYLETSPVTATRSAPGRFAVEFATPVKTGRKLDSLADVQRACATTPWTPLALENPVGCWR